MTTYRQVKGYSIKSVASNPDNANVGQVWYNSTEKKIKGQLTIAAAWASGGNLNTGRSGLGGAGTKSAALAFGGDSPSLNETEEYNGSSLAEQNNLSTGRRFGAGFGIQTAAVMAGGIVATDN